MARTLGKYARTYVNGYNLSPYTKSLSPLSVAFDEADVTADQGDAVKVYLPDTPSIKCGALNGIFEDTATSGMHAVLNAASGARNVMAAVGFGAAPSQGSPAFCGVWRQMDYKLTPAGAAMYVTAQFGEADVATGMTYPIPWGWLLHAAGAETAVNTAVGIDDLGAASTYGGWLMYQVFAGNGTATIKVQDAATNTNPSFADLASATSGVIDCSNPTSGVVMLAKTATVRRYLRWQIVLGTATTVTFALAFMRGYNC